MKKKTLLIGCLLLTTSYICNGMSTLLQTEVDQEVIEVIKDGTKSIDHLAEAIQNINVTGSLDDATLKEINELKKIGTKLSIIGERYAVVGENFSIVGKKFAAIGERAMSITEKLSIEKLILKGVLPLLILYGTYHSFKQLHTDFNKDDDDKSWHKKRTFLNLTSLGISLIVFTGWFWMLKTNKL